MIQASSQAISKQCDSAFISWSSKFLSSKSLCRCKIDEWEKKMKSYLVERLWTRWILKKNHLDSYQGHLGVFSRDKFHLDLGLFFFPDPIRHDFYPRSFGYAASFLWQLDWYLDYNRACIEDICLGGYDIFKLFFSFWPQYSNPPSSQSITMDDDILDIPDCHM